MNVKTFKFGRLEDIEVQRVDAVDAPASRRAFLIMKRERAADADREFGGAAGLIFDDGSPAGPQSWKADRAPVAKKKAGVSFADIFFAPPLDPRR